MLEFTNANGINSSFVVGAGSSTAPPSLILRFEETYDGAFSDRSEESGGAGLGRRCPVVALADSGTRFLVRFKNVPQGSRLFVTPYDLEDPQSDEESQPLEHDAVSLTEADPNGNAPVDGRQVIVPDGYGGAGGEMAWVALPVSGGYATGTWEWVGNRSRRSARGRRNVCFGVLVVSQPGQAALGTAWVAGALAPLSDLVTATTDGPIPRFIDGSEDLPAFRVSSADGSPDDSDLQTAQR